MDTEAIIAVKTLWEAGLISLEEMRAAIRRITSEGVN
jgi:hypothetical protein